MVYCSITGVVVNINSQVALNVDLISLVPPDVGKPIDNTYLTYDQGFVYSVESVSTKPNKNVQVTIYRVPHNYLPPTPTLTFDEYSNLKIGVDWGKYKTLN